MMFPFVDTEIVELEEKKTYIPKEYGINFETGQLSGEIVEGSEALRVWAWIALQSARLRYYVYPNDYGQEFDTLIGKMFSGELMESELERMIEECLTANQYISGITNFATEKSGSIVIASFTMITDFGDEEVDVNVRAYDV